MRVRYVVAVVIAVLVTAPYLMLQPDEGLAAVTDSLFALVSGICSILAYLVVRRWGFRGKFGLVYLGLFLGIFLWFLGDTTWAIYEVLLQVEIPYPSIGDVFYLGGYIPIVIGITGFLWAFRDGLTKRGSISGLGIGLVVLGLTYIYLVGPLFVSQSDFLTKISDVAYPVLDSLLVVLALWMFFAFRGAKLAGSWFWISLGLVLTAIADIAFSLGSLEGWYYSGHPSELIYLWGYVSMALGFDDQRGAQFA